jgi:hypothetical protein
MMLLPFHMWSKGFLAVLVSQYSDVLPFHAVALANDDSTDSEADIFSVQD